MYIERLSGKLVASVATGIILDVNGVGYGLEIPLSLMSQLPALGNDMDVWTYSYIKEDCIRLFGFESYQDRYTFEVLIGLNGVGPKVALALLSHLQLQAIHQAVLLDQAYIFESVPGVGKRLAEKIIVELKSKLKKLESAGDIHSSFGGRKSGSDFNSVLASSESGDVSRNWSNMLEDLKSALENLGYKDKQVSPIIKELMKDDPVNDFRVLLKSALKLLQSKRTGAKQASKTRNIIEKELF